MKLYTRSHMQAVHSWPQPRTTCKLQPVGRTQPLVRGARRLHCHVHALRGTAVGLGTMVALGDRQRLPTGTSMWRAVAAPQAGSAGPARR